MRKAVVVLLVVLFGCSGNKLDQTTAEGLMKRILLFNPARFSVDVGRWKALFHASS